MPRPRSISNLTITDLQNQLHAQQRRLSKLTRTRAKIQRQLDHVDAQIAKLSGGAVGGSSGAVRGRRGNSMSLVATIEKVLKQNGKPMAVGDIVAGVLRSGYRSNSANFRGIVNQTLVKEKPFVAAKRGIYQLRK